MAALLKTKPQTASGKAPALPSIGDLEAMLSRLEVESASMQAALDRREVGRAEALLDDEIEVVKRYDAETQDQRLRLEKANLEISRLKGDVERLKQEEVEAAKATERAEVEATVARARQALAGYEAHAKAIVEIIRIIAESDDAIESFARKYPSDERIPGAERVRSQDAQPERVVSRKVVQRWVYAASPWSRGGDIVPDVPLQTLRKEGPRTGHVYAPSGHPSEVVLHDFELLEIIPPAGLHGG
jgi:hypothetical protein